MNIMQKATKHGLSGLLLAVTVLGSVAPLAAIGTPIYADNSQQTGNSDEVSGKPALADQTVLVFRNRIISHMKTSPKVLRAKVKRCLWKRIKQ